MKQAEIKKLVEKQRKYFYTGSTLPVETRLQALSHLKRSIQSHEREIGAALKKDLGKSSYESYMSEIGMVLSEITYMQRHLRFYDVPKPHLTPLSQFPAVSFQKPSPYGVVLIMSPWNYPFMLTMEPLVDAICAGNTVIVKPSAYSPNTSDVIAKIIRECFEECYVSVVEGGREENQYLLGAHFDYIFFTGSKEVGRSVLRHSVRHLTPVTLELGGKSPCIVDRTANIPLAAKRIVWGKFLNCGQTCVAPDYVYCDPAVKDELVRQICLQIRAQFGKDPLQNEDYGHIISQKHFERISGLIEEEKIACGGRTDPENLRIEPTVLTDVTFDDAVMGEEIFGPVLPVLTYDSLGQAVQMINSMDHPLALYLFTRSKKNARYVLARAGFGGGCINDTVIHIATSRMGFGGFGESGMGAYHGRKGYETFSHTKSVVEKKNWLDLPFRYQPYQKQYDKILRMFLK